MIDCRHEVHDAGAVSVIACEDCGLVQFWDETGPILPGAGMARLFGGFAAVGRFPTLRGPGPEAIAYRPPSAAAGRLLDAFPRRAWLEVQAGLWMSHDGEHLLLVPIDPGVTHVAGEGA